MSDQDSEPSNHILKVEETGNSIWNKQTDKKNVPVLDRVAFFTALDKVIKW